MKKLMLMLVLICTAFVVKSQNVTYIEKSALGVWDSKKEAYVWGEFQNIVPIKVCVVAGNVFVYDKANSSYNVIKSTYSKRFNDRIIDFWDCTDENFKVCTLKLITYDSGIKIMTIYYSDVALMYSLVDPPSIY